MTDFQEAQLERKWQFLGNSNTYIWCWILLREFELEVNQEQFQGLRCLTQGQNIQRSATFKIGPLGSFYLFLSSLKALLEINVGNAHCVN